MGNLPPGVSESDPEAPWNQPDYEDLLPLDCTECGFRAETLDELDGHEHDAEDFERTAPKPDPRCMVCNPPADAHRRAKAASDGNESALVFCDDHDVTDYKAHTITADEHRPDPADRYRKGD